MQRKIPLAITFIMGVLMTIQFFIPHRLSQDFFTFTQKWLIAIVSFAVILAVGSLVTTHTEKIKRKREGWYYSIVTLASLVVMSIVGIGRGFSGFIVSYHGRNVPIYELFFEYIVVPLGATMFSLLAFYMASAAYRAFRVRNFNAALLLIAAFVIMGSIVFYNLIFLGDAAEWLLSVPNLAAKRGILLGVGLGAVATAFKIILGVERGYLGAGGGA